MKIVIETNKDVKSVPETNKNVFVEYLNLALLNDCKELAFTRKPLPSQLPAYTHSQFRLTMVIRGKHVYSILGKHGFENVELVPGKVLFCQRGGVTQPIGYRNKEGAEMLTIVFWPEFVRLVLGRLRAGENKWEQIWYHSRDVINHAGMYLLKTLDELIDNDSPNIQVCLLARVLLQVCKEHLLADEPQTSTKSFRTYQSIMVYLYENFGEDINRKSVARKLAISPQHISRIFKAYSEHSFNTVLRRLRFEHAEELLRSTSLLISEIAEECGFANTDYFIKSFRSFYGKTPGRFRRKVAVEHD